MDTGLQSLCALARFHKIPAEPEQLAHEFGITGQDFTDTEILLSAKALSLKAKLVNAPLSSITNAVLPATAKTQDGAYIILAQVKNTEEGDIESVLVHDLRKQAPESLKVTEFEALWTGELVAITKRQGITDKFKV